MGIRDIFKGFGGKKASSPISQPTSPPIQQSFSESSKSSEEQILIDGEIVKAIQDFAKKSLLNADNNLKNMIGKFLKDFLQFLDKTNNTIGKSNYAILINELKEIYRYIINYNLDQTYYAALIKEYFLGKLAKEEKIEGILSVDL